MLVLGEVGLEEGELLAQGLVICLEVVDEFVLEDFGGRGVVGESVSAAIEGEADDPHFVVRDALTHLLYLLGTALVLLQLLPPLLDLALSP